MGAQATGRQASVGDRALFEETLKKEEPHLARSGRADGSLAARVIAVTIAYYLGARIGFLLQTPLVPQSVLWLPNSILLATLIVSPPRTWPFFLVSSLAPQLLVGYQSHAPLRSITPIFFTNCADAMLGALLWRVASRGASRIESLRSMVLFLVFVVRSLKAR